MVNFLFWSEESTKQNEGRRGRSKHVGVLVWRLGIWSKEEKDRERESKRLEMKANELIKFYDILTVI